MSEPPPSKSSLKPRPALFVVACVVMAIWIAALVLMYFKSVRNSTDVRDVLSAPDVPAEAGTPRANSTRD